MFYRIADLSLGLGLKDSKDTFICCMFENLLFRANIKNLVLNSLPSGHKTDQAPGITARSPQNWLLTEMPVNLLCSLEMAILVSTSY